MFKSFRQSSLTTLTGYNCWIFNSVSLNLTLLK